MKFEIGDRVEHNTSVKGYERWAGEQGTVIGYCAGIPKVHMDNMEYIHKNYRTMSKEYLFISEINWDLVTTSNIPEPNNHEDLI